MKLKTEKTKYLIAHFQNTYTNVIEAIGFKYKSEKQLERKLKRAESYGWIYDGVFREAREVSELPDHIVIRF